MKHNLQNTADLNNYLLKAYVSGDGKGIDVELFNGITYNANNFLLAEEYGNKIDIISFDATNSVLKLESAINSPFRKLYLTCNLDGSWVEVNLSMLGSLIDKATLITSSPYEYNYDIIQLQFSDDANPESFTSSDFSVKEYFLWSYDNFTYSYDSSTKIGTLYFNNHDLKWNNNLINIKLCNTSYAFVDWTQADPITLLNTSATSYAQLDAASEMNGIYDGVNLKFNWNISLDSLLKFPNTTQFRLNGKEITSIYLTETYIKKYNDNTMLIVLSNRIFHRGDTVEGRFANSMWYDVDTNIW